MPILSDRFNLTVIDKAYGPSADLYVDVLRVSYLASDEEIQSAFFDRRSEIFTILSKLNSHEDSENDEIAQSQRRFAERRMDAVVMAFRILRASESRKSYEKERERRIASRLAAAVTSGSKSLSPERGGSPNEGDSYYQIVSPGPLGQSPSRRGRDLSQRSDASTESIPNRPRKARPPVSPRTDPRPSVLPCRVDHSQSSIEDEDEDDREERSDRETSSHQGKIEVANRRRRKRNEGVIEKVSESSLVRTFTEEVHGVYLDTMTAFDQVFNAFTLQEQDIQAVCGRIEVAKKELR